MIEIERRFLVAELPDPLPNGDSIVQGYLMTEPASVRVRQCAGRHTLTVKRGSGVQRVEVEKAISAEEFAAIWPAATDLRITKTRHRVAIGDGRWAELDAFEAELAGRYLVEVEFDTVEAAAEFKPPRWFGADVTDDERYTSATLARQGWPADQPE